MTGETRCDYCRETLVALALDELDAPTAEDARRHVETCQSCKGFLEALAEQEKDVRAAFDAIEREVELVADAVIDRLDKRCEQTEARSGKPSRHLMNEVKKMILFHRKLSTVAAAAVLVVAIGAAVYLSIGRAEPAYALEQTIQAWEAVRFLHLTMSDDQAGIEDERWIEVGPDGHQHRYRQESAGMGIEILVVDDRETVFDWRKDKNTVVLWSPKDHSYQWIWDLHGFFRDLQGSPDSVVIERDLQYKGRPAHLVRWLKQNQDIYVDPETKLPIAIGKHEISYEDPPAGIFTIPAIPEGVMLVDKRPGAPKSPEPAWMKQERGGDEPFHAGRKALAEGDYDQAVALFKEAIRRTPLRNWAHFWLGEAYRALGQYDQAIEEYTWVIEGFKKLGLDARYADLARGLAYRQKNMPEEAKKDFGQALNVMIGALRNPEGCRTFDYADDPLGKGKRLTGPERVANMVVRLRDVTAQDFGFDAAKPAEDNDEAIAAWQQWWRQHAKDYSAEPAKPVK